MFKVLRKGLQSKAMEKGARGSARKMGSGLQTTMRGPETYSKSHVEHQKGLGAVTYPNWRTDHPFDHSINKTSQPYSMQWLPSEVTGQDRNQ